MIAPSSRPLTRPGLRFGPTTVRRALSGARLAVLTLAVMSVLAVASIGMVAVPGGEPWRDQPAGAIPPDGASPDTPGTSVTVTPNRLRAGEVIRFTVRGFPSGETINVKIDDGLNCSAAAVHGACVYHQQAIPGSGTVTGSFAIPADIAPGAHWLRFLASAPILDSAGNQIGVNGYTLRGASDFTVIVADSGSATPNTQPGSGGGSGSGGGASGSGAGSGSGPDGAAGGSGSGAEPGGAANGGTAGPAASGDEPSGAGQPDTDGDGDGSPVTVQPGQADQPASDDDQGSDDGSGEADLDEANGEQAAADSAALSASRPASGEGEGSSFPVVGATALALAVAGTGIAVWRTRRRPA